MDVVGPLPLNSGTFDAVVTEVIRYQGRDGRPSARQTRFNLSGLTLAFDFSQTWDELGNVASITYPWRVRSSTTPTTNGSRSSTARRMCVFQTPWWSRGRCGTSGTGYCGRISTSTGDQ